MKNNISRRDFLKLSFLGLLGAGFSPRPHNRELWATYPGLIGRITTDEEMAPIYTRPNFDSNVVRETVFDELIHLYYELKVKMEDKNDNNLWYRVWGGYLHSAYVQPTRYRYNKPLNRLPECGKLAEVTVPYTQSYSYNSYRGWEKTYRLYYGSHHWITGKEPGPDGRQWYKITSELSETLFYYVTPEHLRPISDLEYIPTAIHVPAHEKRIEISLKEQSLTAFEYGEPILRAPISSGLNSENIPPKGTRTPTGEFSVTTKMPSKHMGVINIKENEVTDAYPGVPWVTFFVYESGVAIHGTYWHNNFGHPMSHGCINMQNHHAKWLYRWTTPPYEPPYRNHCSWDVRGNGTRIIVR